MSTSTEEVVNKPREYSEREYSEQNDFVKWRKAKKVAVMASFVGKDYLGMQRYSREQNKPITRLCME